MNRPCGLSVVGGDNHARRRAASSARQCPPACPGDGPCAALECPRPVHLCSRLRWRGGEPPEWAKRAIVTHPKRQTVRTFGMLATAGVLAFGLAARSPSAKGGCRRGNGGRPLACLPVDGRDRHGRPRRPQRPRKRRVRGQWRRQRDRRQFAHQSVKRLRHALPVGGENRHAGHFEAGQCAAKLDIAGRDRRLRGRNRDHRQRPRHQARRRRALACGAASALTGSGQVTASNDGSFLHWLENSKGGGGRTELDACGAPLERRRAGQLVLAVAAVILRSLCYGTFNEDRAVHLNRRNAR